MHKYHISSIKYLPKKITISVSSVVKLLYFKPQYFFLAALISILFYELIFWFLNLGLAQYLLTSPFLSLSDKLSVAISSYSGIFTYPLSGLATTLFMVSILQGITIACFTYIIRHERKISKGMVKNLGGTGLTGLLSVLGLGCAACGTSLVTPILTFFFASSSVALAEAVGFYSVLFALLIAMITTYLVGLKLATKLAL